MLAHRVLCDCWGFPSNNVGSLFYNLKPLEATAVVNRCSRNKTKLNLSGAFNLINTFLGLSAPAVFLIYPSTYVNAPYVNKSSPSLAI